MGKKSALLEEKKNLGFSIKLIFAHTQGLINARSCGAQDLGTTILKAPK